MDKVFRNILHLLIFSAIGLMTMGNPSDLYGQRRASTGAEEKDHGQEEHHETDPAHFIEEREEEFSRLEAEWEQRREEINEHFEEWEAEVERRRDKEGRDFDQQGFEDEREHMERRRDLELRALKLDEDFARRHHELMKQEHGERLELEAEFRALDERAHQAGSERRRSEIDRHFAEWEAEQQERREVEGDDFDEEYYELEREHMERRRDLEVRRMELDEELHAEHMELDQQRLPEGRERRARRELERREERAREELEAEFRELERELAEEAQEFWREKHRSEIDRHFAEWEAEQQERREVEGDDFDEEYYELEREHMERRRDLEMRRMELDEKLHAEHMELDQQGLPEGRERRARRELERREERAREEMEAEFRELEEELAKEADEFWRNRDEQDHGHDEEWADDPGHGEDLDINELQEIVDEIAGEYPGVGDLYSHLKASVQKELDGECDDCVEKDIKKVARYASLRRLDREDEEQLVNLAEHYAEVLRHELSDSQEEHEDAGWGDSEEDAEHAISLEDAVNDYGNLCGNNGHRLPGHGAICEEAAPIVRSEHADDVLAYAVDNYGDFCGNNGYQLPGHGVICEEAAQIVRNEDEEHESAGPNSVRLVVASVDGDEVVVNIEIAESDPINGWGMQISYDKSELEFTQFIPGGFIGGTFIPIHTETDSGVQLGGAQFGNQGMSEGDGVLGSIKLQIIGSLPTWISASDLQLKGDLENETNLASDRVEIDR